MKCSINKTRVAQSADAQYSRRSGVIHPSRQSRRAYDRAMASQAVDQILTFTTAKRCVNENLIVHGRAQK